MHFMSYLKHTIAQEFVDSVAISLKVDYDIH